MKFKKSIYLLAWVLALFALWLLLSGKYDLFHISTGVFSSLLVVFIHRRLFAHSFFSDQTSPESIRFFFFCFIYLPWLFYQIILAAISVTKAVIFPKTIDPALILFSTNLPNNTSKVILGNSITLTPGTITLLLEEDEFLVHGLMEKSYSGLVDGSFQTMIAKNYTRKPLKILKSVTVKKNR